MYIYIVHVYKPGLHYNVYVHVHVYILRHLIIVHTKGKGVRRLGGEGGKIVTSYSNTFPWGH